MASEMEFDKGDLVTLTVLDNPIEAQVLEGLLQEHKVRFVMDLSESSALSEIFNPQKGFAKVRVLKDDLDRAQDILADLQSGEESDEIVATMEAGEDPPE